MPDTDQPLENAEEIIERFGGIRPMANKIDVPVTTVQGWKKRGVIPGTRRELIEQAARAHGIDLGNLLDEDAASASAAPVASEQSEAPASSVYHLSREEEETQAPRAAAPFEYKPIEGVRSSDDFMAEIEASERKAVRNSVWASAGLMVVLFLAAGVLLWPQARDVKETVAANSEGINTLESDMASLDETVKDVNARSKFMTGAIPDDLDGKLKGLQTQAQNLQHTFDQLDKQTKEFREKVLAADAGSFSDRIEALEEQMKVIAGSEEFADVVKRVRGLEETVGGQMQLQQAMQELQGIVDNMDSRINGFDEKLAAVQMDENSALGQTLHGVNSTDLKAAAMLIAFAQMRESLNREAPFEDDLVLLQKMVSPENTELQEALTRLAPHADGGVLSAEGLSNEFKGLAGDIVVAAASGEELSVADKAKARLGKLVQIEKDGEVIGGSETQVAVSKAQALLDAGDVQGAIVVLQELEGDAGQKAEPFIEKAEAAMLAEKVQSMLRETILAEVSGVLPAYMTMPQIAPAGADAGASSGAMDLNQIKDTIQQSVTGRKVVTDEESGVSVLPPPQRFKGLSSGQ